MKVLFDTIDITNTKHDVQKILIVMILKLSYHSKFSFQIFESFSSFWFEKICLNIHISFENEYRCKIVEKLLNHIFDKYVYKIVNLQNIIIADFVQIFFSIENDFLIRIFDFENAVIIFRNITFNDNNIVINFCWICICVCIFHFDIENNESIQNASFLSIKLKCRFKSNSNYRRNQSFKFKN